MKCSLRIDGSCPAISALHVTTFEMLDGVGIAAPAAAPVGGRKGAGTISCGATRQEQRSSLHNSSQRNSNWALEKRTNPTRTAICKHDLRRIWQIWQKRKRKQDNETVIHSVLCSDCSSSEPFFKNQQIPKRLQVKAVRLRQQQVGSDLLKSPFMVETQPKYKNNNKNTHLGRQKKTSMNQQKNQRGVAGLVRCSEATSYPARQILPVRDLEM